MRGALGKEGRGGGPGERRCRGAGRQGGSPASGGLPGGDRTQADGETVNILASKDNRDEKAGRGRVFVVDDHPIVREGLRRVLEDEGGLEVCGGTGDPREALKAIAELKPDAAVVDLSLRGGSGLDLIRNIKTRHPGVPVLVLSRREESLYAERALRAGAKGYIMKGQVPAELVGALRTVLSGESYVSDAMSKRMLDRMLAGSSAGATSPLELLSDRQLEVFEFIGQGRTTRQIGELLHISPKTVETHRTHIKDKLRLDTSTEVLVLAIQCARGEAEREGPSPCRPGVGESPIRNGSHPR